jgi:hypothetical protein
VNDGKCETNTGATAQWLSGKTYDLEGLSVSISKPLCVGRSKKQFWYPNIMRFADGTLAMSIRTGDDRLTADEGLLIWSRDGGLTWSKPKPYTAQSFSYCPLPSGEFALLPHHLYKNKTPNGCKGHMNVIDAKGTVRLLKDGVTVAGFPRPFGSDPFNPKADVEEVAKQGRIPFFFNGIPLKARDGTYLTVIEGIYQNAKRMCTIVAESHDGFTWRFRSTVVDDGCDGEACLCYTSDGRLMCIIRRWPLYRQCFSSDEGRTWSEPVAMKKEGSVEPKLLVLQSGTIVLSGGRLGLYLWFNRDGSGKSWQTIDTLAHHNALLPQEVISPASPQNRGGTSSYTGIVEIEPDTFLCVYDRVPDTFRVRTHWKADPKDDNNNREKFSVYVVRVTVQNKQVK